MGWGEKPQFVIFANFHGVNTPSWPVSGYQHYITAQSREVTCCVAYIVILPNRYNFINVNNLNSIDNSKMGENNKN